jgi:hypothetical protein
MTATHADIPADTTTDVPTSAVPASTKLDQLLDRSAKELEAMYARARVPRVSAIRGDLRGRMLAVVIVPNAVRRVLRRFAGSRAFPWLGKSFHPLAGERGEGQNRVVSNRVKLFRFETSIGPSRAGAFDAVQLDYDLRENPWAIRRIKDEIREVRPNLYLGQAYFVPPSSRGAKGDARLVLWFALEG